MSRIVKFEDADGTIAFEKSFDELITAEVVKKELNGEIVSIFGVKVKLENSVEEELSAIPEPVKAYVEDNNIKIGIKNGTFHEFRATESDRFDSDFIEIVEFSGEKFYEKTQ